LNDCFVFYIWWEWTFYNVENATKENRQVISFLLLRKWHHSNWLNYFLIFVSFLRSQNIIQLEKENRSTIECKPATARQQPTAKQFNLPNDCCYVLCMQLHTLISLVRYAMDHKLDFNISRVIDGKTRFNIVVFSKLNSNSKHLINRKENP